MVRFKVIKGSRLLLYFSIFVLAAVIIGMVLSYVLSGSDTSSVRTQADLVETVSMEKEAETEIVFASSNVEEKKRLQLDPVAEDAISIEILPSVTESIAPVATQKPSILIYHTHSHEAYEPSIGEQYVAIEAWRTVDEDHSIVRVGAELAALLESRGFEVVHDTTDHEQDALNTAYTRSLETLKSYDRKFDLYIDLHRDAYIDHTEIVQVYDGATPLAQLMMLIGNGEGFTDKPYYLENLAFAEALTKRINAELPGLCRDVMVKDGRYNQNIGVFSILVEVGHNRNTLTQALSALPYLADGLASLMIREPDELLVEMQRAYSQGVN